MIFILQQEAKFIKDRYDFTPNDYGPYAQELQRDIDDLITRNFIIEARNTIEAGKIKYQYQITDEGKSVVESILSDKDLERKFKFDKIVEIATQVKTDLNKKHLPSLLSDIYEKYPEFARFSIFNFE